MALRPLDNALPMAEEKPKKQVKVVIATQKHPDMSVDEKKAPLPPASTGDASTDYIPSENLKAFADPEIEIQGLFGSLESKDWLKVCESLNDARLFALYHSDQLLTILDKVMPAIVKAMKNPRMLFARLPSWLHPNFRR